MIHSPSLKLTAWFREFSGIRGSGSNPGFVEFTLRERTENIPVSFESQGPPCLVAALVRSRKPILIDT